MGEGELARFINWLEPIAQPLCRSGKNDLKIKGRDKSSIRNVNLFLRKFVNISILLLVKKNEKHFAIFSL